MNSSKDLFYIILAAGKGTRMHSNIPKVLHKVGNTSMIELLLENIEPEKNSDISIVISKENSSIKNHINEKNISFIIQEKQLGTADAVNAALSKIENLDNINNKILIILYGDTPFIDKKIINKLSDQIKLGSTISIAGFINKDANNGYGRLISKGKNRLDKIIEYKDATPEERKVQLCNSGIMAIDLKYAKSLIDKIDNNNNAKEYYLTDIVKIAAQENLISSYIEISPEKTQGINNKIELANANQYYYQLARNKALENGVTMLDPQSVYISHDTEFGKDVIIEPNVFIGKNVKIGNNVKINAFSYIQETKIGNNTNIGPYARLRPGTNISSNVQIGNFIEVKNSNINDGVKAGHLSYIGDSDIGKNTNIGAGTITCNYNGYKKFKTKIGDDVFIGSNSSLIAPVTIDDKSIIAAGSTITENVEKDTISIARSKQKNIKNGAIKFRIKNAK